MADIELNEAPESTWGASEEYKQAWLAKYGNVSPKAGASKAEWEEFAVKNGMTKDEASDATRDDLVARFGAEQVQASPSAPNANIVGQGDGTGPEGNVASDPAKKTATTTR